MDKRGVGIQAVVGIVLFVLLGFIVIKIAYVLMQEPQARERLQRQKGRTVQLNWRELRFVWAFTPAGLLDVASNSATAPDLVLQVNENSPLALVQTVLQGDKPSVRIEGDVQLAAEVNWLIDHVRWEPEEDLARLIGDAMHCRSDVLVDARRELHVLDFRGRLAGSARTVLLTLLALEVVLEPTVVHHLADGGHRLRCDLNEIQFLLRSQLACLKRRHDAEVFFGAFVIFDDDADLGNTNPLVNPVRLVDGQDRAGTPATPARFPASARYAASVSGSLSQRSILACQDLSCFSTSGRATSTCIRVFSSCVRSMVWRIVLA